MKEKPLTEFLKSEKIIKEKVKKEEVKRAPKLKEVEGPWELPEGWRWVTLGDVLIEDKTPINPQEFPEKDFWLVTMDNVESHTGRLIKRVIVKGREIQSTKYVFNEEHILYGKLRPYLNKVYEPDGRGICTTEFVPFRVKDCADKRFVAIYLRSPWVVSYANSLTKGARQPRVRIKDLLDFPIPLPPLPEQKRIVAKLDEIHTKLEEAKRLAREAKGQAEKLMASALHEIFSKAEERGWEWVRLEKVINIRGNSGVKKKLSQFDKVAFIPMELIPERGVFARYEVRDSNEIKSYSYCEPGDILLAKITPSFENGKQGIVPSDVPNEFALATTEVYPIYVKDTNRLNRMYLFYLLRSTYARKILEEQMLGTTGRQRVPKEAVLKLKIPLPPLEEQKCIVTYLDRINEKAQRLIKLYEKREREFEQLFPAILNKAFRGELV